MLNPGPGVVVRPPPIDSAVVQMLLERINANLERATHYQPVQSVTAAPGTKRSRAKRDQSFKYDGGVIRRAFDVMINGRGPYTDPKEEGRGTMGGVPRREQETNFFITINPGSLVNIPGDHESYRVRQVFNETMGQIANNINAYLKFGPVDVHYRNDVAGDVITESNVGWESEVGDVQHRVHAHMIVKLVHYSQIQIHKDNLVKGFIQLFNKNATAAGVSARISKGVWVYIELLKQNGAAGIMRRYMEKNGNTTSSGPRSVADFLTDSDAGKRPRLA